MNTPGPELPSSIIPAHSKRQVMDWSLVLASQEIPTTIVESDPTGWALVVAPEDHDRAREAIRLYRLENRRWGWRQPIPWSEASFHWGALGWCLLLVFIHWLSLTDLDRFRPAALFVTASVHEGQWWRAFTAILLHQDLAHLLANCTTGLILCGLAMARYGAGLGLLAAYLAGATGNFAGLVLYPEPYTGLGASGMVMGALGLLCIPVGLHWSRHPHALRQIMQAAFGGLFLFLILGVNPKSDLIAHLGGFVAGTLFGVALAPLPQRLLQSSVFVAVTWVILLTLFTWTLILAIRAS